MTYARQLRATYPELSPTVDDLFLLEAHQIAQLPERAPERELAVVLHAHPRLHRFFVARHRPIETYLASLMAAHAPGTSQEVADCEMALPWEIGDWILYQRMPELYDERTQFEADVTAIVDVAPLDGRVVIDAGAGTGQVTFAVAPVAEHVYAIEPVANLRRYVRDQAKQRRIGNVFVMDGLLHDMPLPPGAADVVLTRQAIGWDLDAELDEIERVLGPGGTALHLLGMPHPPGPDDPLHSALVARGYEAGAYREGGLVKRRYWARVGR